jgi:hypothetical protein
LAGSVVAIVLVAIAPAGRLYQLALVVMTVAILVAVGLGAAYMVFLLKVVVEGFVLYTRAARRTRREP